MAADTLVFGGDRIPKKALVIIGAGRFGSRAVRLLGRAWKGPVFVADVDADRFNELRPLPVTAIPCDGIQFLVENFPLLDPACTIIPAVPVNLAFEWVRGYLENAFRIQKIAAPQILPSLLPHAWTGSEGSLLVSFADFQCPDDCSEPEHCTVTGRRRDIPLYALLQGIDIPGFRMHVIRSRQLAPGVGGFRAGDLSRAAKALASFDSGKWLLGTACRCHGIVTGLEMEKK